MGTARLNKRRILVLKRNRVWKGYLIVLGVFLAIALLLNGTTLLNDVKAGQPVTLEDVDLSGRSVYDLYLKGLEL